MDSMIVRTLQLKPKDDAIISGYVNRCKANACRERTKEVSFAEFIVKAAKYYIKDHPIDWTTGNFGVKKKDE